MTSFLLSTFVPRTVAWGPQVAIVMILCNIAAIAIGKATIRNLSAGPALPSVQAFDGNAFGGMGWPALLATWSLGHVMGMGSIIGLATIGLL